MESTPTLGNISFSTPKPANVNENGETSLDGCFPTLVKVAGAYLYSGRRYSFEETRAHYSRMSVLKVVCGRLPDYDVSVEPPIVIGDPCFTLVARRKELPGDY